MRRQEPPVRRVAVITAILLGTCWSGGWTAGSSGNQKPFPAESSAGQGAQQSSPTLTLADFERMALQNNPVLAQADAAIRAAEGRRRQAGLWPNPIIGYQGEELAFRGFNEKSEHFFFVEQTIPLGGKLAKSRRVFEQEGVRLQSEALAVKQRVLNEVRALYYQALAAQQSVELRSELARIAAEAVKTTSELLNVGQADRPDYLGAEIEAQQVELDLETARNDAERIWRSLTAVAGIP
jgi:cobalt-zinc-cadmium efflux system outer membrane protein